MGGSTEVKIGEREYFVLSVNHTTRDNPYIVLWGANDAGYRGRIEFAGRYTESAIKANITYYNNGISTIAVPCDVLEAVSHRVPPKFFDTPDGRWLRNNRETWKIAIRCAMPTPINRPRPEYRGAPRGSAE